MSALPETTQWGHDAPTGGRLKAATGTRDPGLQEVLVRQVQETMPASPLGPLANTASLSEAAVVALAEIGPRDLVDGMLAGQFVAVHCASMDCVKRATEGKATAQVRDMNLRHADRLMATGLRLLEALDRRQGRGRPNVMVDKLVNVEPGGQALVGVKVDMGPAEPHPDERIKRSASEERDDRQPPWI
jgi:hypothetical protein